MISLILIWVLSKNLYRFLKSSCVRFWKEMWFLRVKLISFFFFIALLGWIYKVLVKSFYKILWMVRRKIGWVNK